MAARQAHARSALCGIALILLVAGCAPGGATTGPAAAPADIPPSQARPLVIFIRVEPASVATRGLVQTGAALRIPFLMFNALPTRSDAQGAPLPELLASLPALNTDSWRVFPDGTMETTYTLRPNLTWHDGEPLTSADFVFAWRVYSSPDLGFASHAPLPAISEVAALDRARFMIRWKVLYPDADTLSELDRELPPLPQQLLGPAFDRMATTGRESFASHPFWGPQYVGLGPYRLQQWEAGSYIDAVRFEGYVFGAPKVPRVQLRFSADQNVVVASLLAGEAHVATANALAQNPEALTQQWDRTKQGSVLQFPSSLRYAGFQLRPDFANPRAILDSRVRKAIAHAVDRQALSDAVYGGQMIFADTPVWTGSAWGAAMDASVPTYPLDLRASENLMNQAGVNKGSDGLYRWPEGRLSFELATTEDPDSIRELLVLADRLGAAGLDVQQRVIPAALAQDGQLRATFPTIQLIGTYLGQPALDRLASAEIPAAGNRWLGGNRGGWSSREFDQLLSTFNTTLDHGERVNLVRQMLRIFGDEVPWITLLFRATSFAYVAELKGPALTAPESDVGWNIYQWEFQSR
jgi:peptide/nickel transport system substrate-binding protein